MVTQRSKARAVRGFGGLCRALVAAVVLAAPAVSFAAVGLLEPTEVEPTSRRPRGSATESDFRRYTERLVGQWECTVREWDGIREAPVVESSQRRSFQLVLQGRFLEESAYVLDASGWIQAGLHLTSFDDRQGRLLSSGFWSDIAGRQFAIDAVLAPAGAKVDGTMTVRPPSGSVEKRRVAIQFDGDDRHVQRTFRQRPDGTEYLHEELVYVRRQPS
jgi:hypothetical protein